MSPTEIRLRPNTSWRALILSIAGIAGVYLFLDYVPFILVIIAPIVVIVALVGVIRGQTKDPIIILNDVGVFDRRLKVGVIRWADIRRIRSYSLSGARYISIELHDAKRYQSRRPFWLTILSQAQRLFGMTSIAISTSALEVDHDTLFYKIQEGCGAIASNPRTHERD